MAAIVRRANASNIAANTRTRLYTVPTGKVAVIRTITMSNDNGSAVTMGVTHNTAGFLWKPTVAASGSRVYPLGTVLLEAQYIEVEHSSTGCYTMMTYVEMDRATEGRNLWSLAHTSVQATTGAYTVPTGKRVRVREIVVCPHDTSGNYNSYINSVGHFAKGVGVNEPTVISTDMVVNAGEVISSAATTATTHMFYSGVIEDA